MRKLKIWAVDHEKTMEISFEEISIAKLGRQNAGSKPSRDLFLSYKGQSSNALLIFVSVGWGDCQSLAENFQKHQLSMEQRCFLRGQVVGTSQSQEDFYKKVSDL